MSSSALESAHHVFLQSRRNLENALDNVLQHLNFNNEKQDTKQLQRVLGQISGRNNCDSKSIEQKIEKIKEILAKTPRHTVKFAVNNENLTEFEVIVARVKKLFQLDSAHPKLNSYLQKLLTENYPISKEILKKLEAGIFLNQMRSDSSNPSISAVCEKIISKWKKQIKLSKSISQPNQKQSPSQPSPIKKPSLLSQLNTPKPDYKRRKLDTPSPSHKFAPKPKKPTQPPSTSLAFPSKFKKITKPDKKTPKKPPSIIRSTPRSSNVVPVRTKPKQRKERAPVAESESDGDEEDWERDYLRKCREGYAKVRQEENRSKKLGLMEDMDASDVDSIAG